jgi:hypothetical protein
MTRTYRPRIVDSQLDRRLGSTGAVLLEGPKACGKTSTAGQRAASTVRLDADPSLRAAGLADPSLLLEGETPHLIDEWQLVPEVWNAVRAAVDERDADGQFILTGSATPSDDLTRHSGAMRIARIRMHPMSSAESGDSNAEVSLGGLLAGEPARSARTDTTLRGVAEVLCRGGWPSNLRRETDQAMAANRDYVRTVAATDVVTLDGVRRDPRRVQALIFALARNSASYVTKRTLSEDAAGYGESVSAQSVDSYLDALARLWVAVPQPAWGERLRSAAQVRRTPKWHLADPSLAAAALGASPASLVSEPGAFGQLFESLVFRDLSVYAQAHEADVFAYQDSAGREIDAVVVKDGTWAGFEVKLSAQPSVVDDAATKLARVASGMRKPPAALAVVVSTGPSYRRADGVNVVSITTLGP